MNLQLETEHLMTVKKIVKQHVDDKVWQPIIFGSRACGRARKYSDIDIGFLGPRPVSQQVIYRVIDDFEESDLPYKVDVVDFYNVDENFKRIALKSYKRI